METIDIASALQTNECVSRFDLRLCRCLFWILMHIVMQCNGAIIKDICIVSPEQLSCHFEIIWIMWMLLKMSFCDLPNKRDQFSYDYISRVTHVCSSAD